MEKKETIKIYNPVLNIYLETLHRDYWVVFFKANFSERFSCVKNQGYSHRMRLYKDDLKLFIYDDHTSFSTVFLWLI